MPETETRWKVGDRVGSGWHGGHCSECKRCVRGDFVTCEKEAINGVTRDGGASLFHLFVVLDEQRTLTRFVRNAGHAQFVTLRTEAVTYIPEDIEPAKAAPLLCASSFRSHARSSLLTTFPLRSNRRRRHGVQLDPQHGRAPGRRCGCSGCAFPLSCARSPSSSS